MSGTPLLLKPEALAYKPPKEKKVFKLPKGKKLWIIVIAVVVLEAAATEVYLLTHRKSPPVEESAEQMTADQVAQKKRAEVVDAVQRQVELPTGEEPVFATVSDPQALKNQDFFSEAQVGDKILMYRNAKKAFLYRPSTQQVLAQAPLQYGNNTAVAGASTSAALER